MQYSYLNLFKNALKIFRVTPNISTFLKWTFPTSSFYTLHVFRSYERLFHYVTTARGESTPLSVCVWSVRSTHHLSTVTMAPRCIYRNVYHPHFNLPISPPPGPGFVIVRSLFNVERYIYRIDFTARWRLNPFQLWIFNSFVEKYNFSKKKEKKKRDYGFSAKIHFKILKVFFLLFSLRSDIKRALRLLWAVHTTYREYDCELVKPFSVVSSKYLN